MNFLCLAAQFYVALWPVGGPNFVVTTFFQDYLAGPFLIVLYFIWKIYSWFMVPEHRPLYVKIRDIDIYSGMREGQMEISGRDVPEEVRRQSVAQLQSEYQRVGIAGWAKAAVGNIF
jgi:amino acid transporter